VPATLEQKPPTQKPASQSQSVAHGFGMHLSMLTLVLHAKLAGQPVWLHGSGWQPCASAAADPTAQVDPAGQVYPASQSTGTQP